MIATNTSAASSTVSTSDGSNGSVLSDDKIVVKEVTSYAGETIEITKTVLKGSKEADRLGVGKKKDNLAALVASLSSKKEMNTLAKTRVDWDISKELEGDAEELKKFTKNGYVEKMSFLSQADSSQYHIVKEKARMSQLQQKNMKERQNYTEDQQEEVTDIAAVNEDE